jgi:hypoxanthine-guanine phosphoribosyltransferase
MIFLLGVLRGAMMVVADLARMPNHDRVENDWITVSSYCAVASEGEIQAQEAWR